MMNFEQYVTEKTIAIVGPAPSVGDQSAEVDAHDLVYRCSYGYTYDLATGEERFESGRMPDGYGNRVDMTFYNAGSSRLAGTGRLDNVYMDVDWAIHKVDPGYHSPLTRVRTANMPRLPGRPAFAPNQVTIMLYDLTFFPVKSVTVFGVDFYMGPTETWYDTKYMPAGWEAHSENPCESLTPTFHDQEDQRVVTRHIREACGWPVGDRRFTKALWTPEADHRALMDAQVARHASQPATV